MPPYIAPAAINNEMPPSIGTHGGGQQSGAPPDPPPGGLEGLEKMNVVQQTIKRNIKINFVFINQIQN